MKSVAIDKSQEKQKTTEKSIRRTSVAKYIGRTITAGLIILGPLDLAASDAASARLYGALKEDVHLVNNNAVNDAVVDGLELVAITGAAGALGIAAAKNKNIQNMAGDFNEYLEVKREKMGTKRKALSKILNSPLKVFESIGTVMNKAGNVLEGRKSNIAKSGGKLLVESGVNNAIGTTNSSLLQTMNGHPPSVATNLRYGVEVAVPFVAAAEIVNGLDHIPGASGVMGTVGRHLLEYSSINIHNLSSGDIALSGLTAILAYSSWNIAKYREQKQALMEISSIEQPQLQ